jgi:hypothetical protein
MEIMMANPNDNLIWLDMEMTGLFPDSDRIIEFSCGRYRCRFKRYC